jgi:hypothetical protein
VSRRGFRSALCPCGFPWAICPRRDELGPGRAACPARAALGRSGRLKRLMPALRPLWAFGFPGAPGRSPPPAMSSMMPNKPLPAAVFLLALTSSPAIAGHCPLGQLWRVHLEQCVDITSSLAKPYVQHRAARVRFAEVEPPARRAADASPPPSPPPPQPDPIEHRDALDSAFVLPALADGAPEIWRFCQAAPKMCKGQ